MVEYGPPRIFSTGKVPDKIISNLVNSLCPALGIHQFVYSQRVAQQRILEEVPNNVITTAEFARGT